MQTESSPASAQSSLGQQLRAQRLARHMSIDDIASELKLPAGIIEAMEHDDNGQLGAAVFARGRYGSYARLLGIPMHVVDTQFAPALVEPPALVSNARSSRIEYALRRFARQGIYVVLTATIVLPVVWLATHNQLPQSTASLTALDSAPAVAHHAANAVRNGANAGAREARNEPPVVASITPFGNYRWTNSSEGSSSNTASASASADAGLITANSTLQLRFSGDSWVDIVGVDGHVIQHGAVEAGSVLNYQASAVARVTIGNPGSVLALRNGEPFDLKPFQNADTTRFTLSSDGKPAPVRD